MARQGFDLQLTQYDERGGAGDVLHDYPNGGSP